MAESPTYKEGLLDESTQSLQLEDAPKASFAWDHVTYSVKSGKDTKTILHGVSGYVCSGSLYAIMGPSGSGKTTLLDILANRKSVGDVGGSFYVNGISRSRKSFRRLASYVPQDDVLLGTMTVRETLMFHASLKLPAHVNKAEYVNWTLNQLSLNKVADQKVGNQFIRGISGGEKRRVSIAVELITAPSILFLDEPTTGLSATDALRVMECLQNLSVRHGRTIVCTIHQPRSNIFGMLDGVMLLSEGNIVFNGPPQHVTPYFEALGYDLPPLTNPADFMLDIITVEQRENITKSRSLSLDTRSTADGAQGYLVTAESVRYLVEQYSASPDADRCNQSIADALKRPGPAINTGDDFAEYATGPMAQTGILLKRCLISNFRNPAGLWVRFFSNIVIALIVGSVYYKIANTTKTVEDRTALLFFMIAHTSLGAITVLPNYIDERLLFVRERGSGAYRSLPYFLANTIADIPVQIIVSMAFIVIVYYMTNLASGFDKFLYFLLVVSLVGNIGASFVQMLGVVSPDATVGNALSSSCMVFFMLFAGFLVRPENIPKAWKWAHYASWWTYGFQATALSEFSGLMIPDPSTGTAAPGSVYLSGLGIQDLSKWEMIYVLLGFYLFNRIVCYLLLKYYTRR